MSELRFFNLQDGQSADVRLLHSNVSTIEECRVHYIQIDGKRKDVRCCDNGCPICISGNQYNTRAYIRLWDYTDNTEKVWVRSNQILSQFADVGKAWGTLGNVVMKITRVGKDYPTYNVSVYPPNTYPAVNAELDTKIAYRFSYRRSIEELNEFCRTGRLPERKKQEQYVSKEAYAQQKADNQQKNYMPNTQQQFAQQVSPQPAYTPNMPQPQYDLQNGYNQHYAQYQHASQQPQYNPTQNAQQPFVGMTTAVPLSNNANVEEDDPFSDVIMDMPRRV